MSIIEDVKIPFLKEFEEGMEVMVKSVFERGGQYNKYSAKVETMSGGIYQLGVNDTSVGRMVSAWGNDSSKWIGKMIKLSYEDFKTIKGARVWNPIVEEA